MKKNEKDNGNILLTGKSQRELFFVAVAERFQKALVRVSPPVSHSEKT
jgi:hypothetical protein